MTHMGTARTRVLLRKAEAVDAMLAAVIDVLKAEEATAPHLAERLMAAKSVQRELLALLDGLELDEFESYWDATLAILYPEGIPERPTIERARSLMEHHARVAARVARENGRLARARLWVAPAWLLVVLLGGAASLGAVSSVIRTLGNWVDSGSRLRHGGLPRPAEESCSM